MQMQNGRQSLSLTSVLRRKAFRVFPQLLSRAPPSSRTLYKAAFPSPLQPQEVLLPGPALAAPCLFLSPQVSLKMSFP